MCHKLSAVGWLVYFQLVYCHVDQQGTITQLNE